MWTTKLPSDAKRGEQPWEGNQKRVAITCSWRQGLCESIPEAPPFSGGACSACPLGEIKGRSAEFKYMRS